MTGRWLRRGSVITAAISVLATLSAPAAVAAAVTPVPGSVTPATIVGGDGAVQTIRLSGPAPAGGVQVSLSGSDVVYGHSTGRSVLVPAGERAVSFPIQLAAPASTSVRELWAQVTGSGLTKVAEVTVVAADPATRAVRALRFDAAAAVLGSTVEGTVELLGPAPAGGIAVSLWSNTHYGPGLHVPPYVVVPAGATTASFPATVTRAEEPGIVSPSADLGTSRAGTDLVVVPQRFSISGGLATRGTATAFAVGIGSAPNPSGTTVALRSDTPGVTVPATVAVPPGSPGTTFPVTVEESVPHNTIGHLTATWNGTTAGAFLLVG